LERNTIDLQWEKRANYNATPCASEKKRAVPRTRGTMEKTMDNNEKNNDEEQWEEEKIRGVPTSGCEPTGDDRA
jgi:hypothetical protein